MFDKVKTRNPKRSKFDLSCERKMALKQGYLYPCYVQDVLPGDSIKNRMELMMRFAPMVTPPMHRYSAKVYFFYVPDRLIWEDSEKFHTGGKTGTDAPVPPYIPINTATVGEGWFNEGSLADYLGLPSMDPLTAVAQPVNVSALPFRAYQLIYNEYFRDQNLSDPVQVLKTSGLQDDECPNLCVIRKKAWEKDPFTSALPFTQRGGDVLLPVEGTASVSYLSNSLVKSWNDVSSADLQYDTSGDLRPNPTQWAPPGADTDARIENIDEVSVDGISTTIREFRRANRLQVFFEKMATGGARYWEYLKTIFGVKTKDERLQLPEFLAGASQPVVISEVLSSVFEASADIPQGNMAGHGISVGNRAGFKAYCPEHGWIIGVMAVLPRTAYQQGIHPMFTRTDRFMYGLPDFAHIGEQEVLNREVYYGQTLSDNNATFGYQARYWEYKAAMSTVHGAMRSSLAQWHSGRIFTGRPALNESFVMADPTKRIFAVNDPDVEDMYCYIHHNVSALRPLPYYGDPRL